MSAVKVFADLMSQPSRAMVIFCRATKVPHEFKQVMLKNMDHKTEEFTKLNPFQRVPFIEHNGQTIKESVAAVKYLTNINNIPDHWYPKEPLAQAKCEEYLHWQHTNIRINAAMFFQTKWLIPVMTQKPPNEKRVANFQKGMETNLDQIEQIWLDGGKKKFILGDKLSVADIFACCELEQPAMAGYDVRKDRPILKDYMDRVKAELNPHYDDAHKIVYSMIKKFGGKVPGVDMPMPSKI